MPHWVQIVIGICFLIAAFALSRLIVAWQLKRAAHFIIEDLEAKKALDPNSAVELPYAKVEMFRLGMRDYRPRVLEYMVAEGGIGRTADNRYYLIMRRPFGNG
jgi:hypothetical protein